MASALSKTTIRLHWIVAITMIFLCIVGFYMTNWHDYGYYDLHKAIGVLILLVVVPRVIWRMKMGWPKPLGKDRPLLHVIAMLVHWVLIISTLSMPVFGLLMSAVGGHGVDIFGWQMIDTHFAPGTHDAVPYSPFWAEVGEQGHEINGYLLMGTIVLHVLGALKHHTIDKDGTLRRMLGHSVES